MRSLWSAVIGALLCSMCARVGHANDAAFRGAPADLFPQTQASEQMESEDILLVATRAEWQVTAKYVFKTSSKTQVPLQIGFPELRCWSGQDEPCRNTGTFHDLKTLVDGKPVELEQGKLSERAEWSSYLGTIWLFDVVFPPEGRVTIEHRYRVETGEESMGDRFTEYVIRTGALWGGPIGQARFTVRFPAYAFEVEARAPGFEVTRPRIVDGPAPYVELVAQASALRPSRDLRFAFNARADRAGEAEGLPQFEQVRQDAGVEAVRERLNLLYAAKGFPFRSQELRARFYSDEVGFAPMQGQDGRWKRKLRAFSAFTRDWFLREDREELKWLEQRRDELKLAFDGPSEAGSAAAILPASASPPEPTAGTVPEPPRSAPVSATTPANSPEAAPPDGKGQSGPRSRGACGCELPGGARPSSVPACWLVLAAGSAVVRRRRRVSYCGRRMPRVRARFQLS
ncbi:MAG TPA: DUF4424 family protein [Polyangiaceae bacterium]